MTTTSAAMEEAVAKALLEYRDMFDDTDDYSTSSSSSSGSGGGKLNNKRGSGKPDLVVKTTKQKNASPPQRHVEVAAAASTPTTTSGEVGRKCNNNTNSGGSFANFLRDVSRSTANNVARSDGDITSAKTTGTTRTAIATTTRHHHERTKEKAEYELRNPLVAHQQLMKTAQALKRPEQEQRQQQQEDDREEEEEEPKKSERRGNGAVIPGVNGASGLDVARVCDDASTETTAKSKKKLDRWTASSNGTSSAKTITPAPPSRSTNNYSNTTADDDGDDEADDLAGEDGYDEEFAGGNRNNNNNNNRVAVAASEDNAQADKVIQKVLRRRKKRVVVNVFGTRYDIIREVATEFGWFIEEDGREPSEFCSASPQITAACTENTFLRKAKWYRPAETCQITWVDTSVIMDRIRKLRCFQRVNHFPGMDLLSRKIKLTKQMTKMQKLFPRLYTFYPLSFALHSDATKLSEYIRSLRGATKTFIMKPNGGCQGKGIILTRRPLEVAQSQLKDEAKDYIVQTYIHRPMLIDSKKFDMRIYVLLLSVNPLRVLIHREGLVRICAHDYVKPTASNLKDACAHLTNYSLNKDADEFVVADDGASGFKRDFNFFETFVDEEYAKWSPSSPQASSAATSTAAGSKAAPSGEEDEDDPVFDAQIKSPLTPLSQQSQTLRRTNSCSATNSSSKNATLSSSSSSPASSSPVFPAKSSSSTATTTTTAANFSGFVTLHDANFSAWEVIWQRIDQLVILTLLSAYHELQHIYCSATNSSYRDGFNDGRICFEVLGFDVMLNQNLRPYLIEVNHSPSLFTDTGMDYRIKHQVVTDVFKHLNSQLVDVRKCSELHYRREVVEPEVNGVDGYPRKPKPGSTMFRQIFPPCAEGVMLGRDRTTAAPTTTTGQEEEKKMMHSRQDPSADMVQAYVEKVTDMYDAVVASHSFSLTQAVKR